MHCRSRIKVPGLQFQSDLRIAPNRWNSRHFDARFRRCRLLQNSLIPRSAAQFDPGLSIRD